MLTRTVAALLAVFAHAAWCAPTGQEVLDAVRSGDASTLKRLLARRAPVNAADESGASALMYAALYSDDAVMRLLLDRGADPNHADESGGTALMLSASDPVKVRLLLDRGANVNAVAKSGRTALLMATGRPGSVAVVRMLLDKGADTKAADKEGRNVMVSAAQSGDTQIVKLLLDRGLDPNAAAQVPFTPLFMAGLLNRRAAFETLLAAGADPKKTPGGGLVSEMGFTDAAFLRKMVGLGANAKQQGPLGQDLLTVVASSDIADPDVVRELIRLGLDPNRRVKNLHIDHGYGADPETALDWAKRRGNTQTVRVLTELTTNSGKTNEPADPPKLNAGSPRVAIEKALPLLYEGGREFFKRSGCTSCHHNMLPAVAFSAARSNGIAVDDQKVRRNSQQSVSWLKGNQPALLQDMPLPGGNYTAGYLLWSLAADGYTRDRATDAAVIHLAAMQSLEGDWTINPFRPPIEASQVTATATAIRALSSYPIPQRRAEFNARIRRAARWLANFSPRTGEERAMTVLGLAWAGSEPQALRLAADQLLSAQRESGGWPQLETLQEDAYATGQALYALQTAGRLPRPALDKGVRFLLATQLADGSWHVRSRSYPVQTNYFDTGFPHGRDQWISAAATSWACIGLSVGVKP